MTYTSSQFSALKGNCPICNGEHKSCKSSIKGLIHCRSQSEPPLGYEFKGIDGINFAMYAPAREDSRGFDYAANRQLRLAKQARQQQQVIKALENQKAIASLPSIEDRDRKIRSYPQKLTQAQKNDLSRRGLTQAEIDYALSQHYFFSLGGGYGIAAYDPISGKLCGAQRANDDRTKKYTWGVFTCENKLQETGENPLFVWVSTNFDSAKPYQIKYCEGALKSYIRACFEWRSNAQIIIIGAAGGIFGKNSLERVLGVFPDATSHTLLCDSDTQNPKKLNIDRAYRNLADAIPSLKFADWGQWQEKSKLDCDETYGTDDFNNYQLRSPDEFIKFFDDLKRQAWLTKKQEQGKAHWLRSKSYKPDITFHAEKITLANFPIPESNTICAIKSDFGTGKTQNLKYHVLAADRQGLGSFLAGHRNMLLAQTVDAFKEVVPSFMMIKEDVSYIRMNGIGKAGCLDQLTNNKFQHQDFDDEILIIDESDQVELHLLLSGTLKDKRDEVYRNWVECIRRADKIYMLSACLVDAVVDFVVKLRANPETKVIKYENTFVHNQIFKIYEPNDDQESNSRVVVRTLAIAHAEKIKWWKFELNDEERDRKAKHKPKALAICADSQTEIESLDNLFKSMGLNGKRIDRKDEDGDNSEFIRKIDTEIQDRELDYLLFSPTANSGVSSVINDYFSDIYCLYFGVLDIDSFLQMPVRVRDNKVIRHIACPEKVNGFSDGEDFKGTTTKEVSKYLSDYFDQLGMLTLAGEDHEVALMELVNQLKQASTEDAQFLRLSQVQAMLNYEKANLLTCLKERLTMIGHKFEIVENLGHSKEKIEELKASKQSVQWKESKAWFNAADITIEEATKLKKRSEASYPIQCQINKAFLKDRMQGIEHSPLWSDKFLHFVRVSDRNFIKKAEMRYMMQNPDIAKMRAADQVAKKLPRDKTAIQDFRAALPKIKAYQDIGIYELSKYEGGDLHGEHPLIKSICDRAKERTNKTRLGMYQSKSEPNMQFVGRLLDGTGYGFQCATKKRKGDDQIRLYKLVDELEVSLFKFVFGLFQMSKVTNIFAATELNIIHQKLVTEAAALAFSEFWLTIETRFERYKTTRKMQVFDDVILCKNETQKQPKSTDRDSFQVGHPSDSFSNKTTNEDVPYSVMVEITSHAPAALVAIAPVLISQPNSVTNMTAARQWVTDTVNNEIAPQSIDPYELKYRAYQRGWDGNPYSLMQYA